MDIKHLLRSKGLRIVAAVILVIAIVLCLFSCNGQLSWSELLNPLGEAEHIDHLHMGEDPLENEQKDPMEEFLPDDLDQDVDDPNNTADGDGDEGQEDGNQGSEGDLELDTDLAVVLSFEKNGTNRASVVCEPGQSVSAVVNTAWLSDNILIYDFALAGEQAKFVKIDSVTLAAGDTEAQEVRASGEAEISLPANGGSRNYTFIVKATMTKTVDGNIESTGLQFTYVLRCQNAPDLDLQLQWTDVNAETHTITCYANATAGRTLHHYDIENGMLPYKLVLTGTEAEQASIVAAGYCTQSGSAGDTLSPTGGILPLKTAVGSDRETYYITVTAKIGTQTITYTYTLVFVRTLDVQLKLTWYQSGIVARSLTCANGATKSDTVLSNQLSAGRLLYDVELVGNDAAGGRITSLSYTCDAGLSGTGNYPVGSVPMTLPAGYTANNYTITVKALVSGQWVNFTFRMNFHLDATLEMRYTVQENGVAVERVLTCENGKSRQAETIYDDELSGGLLSYALSVSSLDGPVTITSVKCNRPGGTVSLQDNGTTTLKLNGNKVGYHYLTITASGPDGNAYSFNITIPYKHRGTNSVRIQTNLSDGLQVNNETPVNLTVLAWSEDDVGNRDQYILATGTDTILRVTLDGEELSYTSTSGNTQEYTLYPKNPETGDENTHILTIYAEDSYGNYDSLTLTLNGQRVFEGMETGGKATITIDLSVLGLGTSTYSYDVLVEPISQSVVTCLRDQNGIGVSYSGSISTGFYLSRLSGLPDNAKVLSTSTWPGSTQEEILSGIDAALGEGSGAAALWRCIYLNGLTKSGGSSGSYGEFDFSRGSGWLYCLNGSYYPGQSMSALYLQDGDQLTLRYTLAFGWDVGSGTPGYGNTHGYCAYASGGGVTASHTWEEIINEDQSRTIRCKYCYWEQVCAHDITYMPALETPHLEHQPYCARCNTWFPMDEGNRVHTMEHRDENANTHFCTVCGYEEQHNWYRVASLSTTATCQAEGLDVYSCSECGLTRSEITEKVPCHPGNVVYTDIATGEKFTKCYMCGRELSRESCQHQWELDEELMDVFCTKCGMGHCWDLCPEGAWELTLVAEQSSCTRKVLECECGAVFTFEGDFHDRDTDGICTICGDGATVHTHTWTFEEFYMRCTGCGAAHGNWEADDLCPSRDGGWIGDPTTDACGNLIYECEECGESFRVYSDSAVHASVVNGICTVCGQAVQVHIHTWVWGDWGLRCTGCGKNHGEGGADDLCPSGFGWVDATATDACGNQHYACDECGETFVEYAATGHTFVNGICSVCGLKEPAHTHTWENGVCSGCAEACEHSKWTNGICNTCGMVCAHETWGAGTWSYQRKCTTCGMLHEHPNDRFEGNVLVNGCCSVCGYACTHSNWKGGDCVGCGIHCHHEEWETTYNFGVQVRVCKNCRMYCMDDLSVVPTQYLSSGNYVSHDWQNGECSRCHKACNHSDENNDNICDICGNCNHAWENGICVNCNLECTHEERNVLGVCTNCSMECLHPSIDGNHRCVDCKTCIHDYAQGVCKYCGKTCSPHVYVNHTCKYCGLCDHQFGNDRKCIHCGVCNHFWKDGRCFYCGEACSSHVYVDHTCIYCGACQHRFGQDQKCIYCGLCKHYWVKGSCVYCGEECSHPSYTEGDVCSVCKQEKLVEEVSEALMAQADFGDGIPEVPSNPSDSDIISEDEEITP